MVSIVYIFETIREKYVEVLSDILSTIRVKGSVYFCDLLETPWVKEFTGTTNAGFHLVRRGECCVRVGDELDSLGPGDLIFLSAGVDHQLSSHNVDTDGRKQAMSTLLLCGYCEFDQQSINPLFDLFPRMSIIRSEELTRHPWLKSTLEQLGTEYLSQSPGAEIAVNKLTEVVLIELVRINFGRGQNNSLLSALGDKAVSKALDLVHNNISYHWTLEKLAGKVALSRAAFAKRFKNLLGQGMFQYLTNLRIQKAKVLLLDTDLLCGDVAGHVGYESEQSFQKAFKKQTGMTPRQFRKRLGAV